MNIFQTLIQWILDLVQSIWDLLFGSTDFSVLWNWLPSDIQAACASLVMILFLFVLIRFIRSILPF